MGPPARLFACSLASIIDFKQTNKPKKVEWITDYKLQLAAYAMAHNYMHKTNITKGVIMMCSKDNYYQEFVVEGDEFKKYQHQWLGDKNIRRSCGRK